VAVFEEKTPSPTGYSLKKSIHDLQTILSENPQSAPAWKEMGELFLIDGDVESSNEAFRRHLRLTCKDPELIHALELFSAGKIGQAEQLARLLLKNEPTNVTAMRLLAEIGMRVGMLRDAQHLLERALDLAPDFFLARLSYAHVLNKRDKLAPALAQLDQLLALKPNDFPLLVLQASILVKFGDCQPALDAYAYLLANHPPQAKIALSYAHTLKTAGRHDDAVAAYRFAIELQANFGDAYWSLANLKTFEFEDLDITLMKAELEQCKGSQNAFHFCFALGKALEQRGQYDKSFAYYQKGNAIKEELEVYDADATTALVARIKAACTADLFSPNRSLDCSARDPIFIVGLPRSGSTLLEQILATHSQVDGTKELGQVIAQTRRLGGRRKRGEPSQYPEILQNLTSEQLQVLAQEYLDETQVQRAGAPFFIDKMPNNFFHLGLIAQMFPNAKIIDARRDSMDACFSCFKQLFAKGQAFTYSLDSVGRYYRDYLELMTHWDKVMPGRVLRVQYEELVSDTEHQVRRVLEFCELNFEPSCLEFYRNERPVRTASSEQVRQPIHRGGIGYWRNYEGHLDELKSLIPRS
jgi:tetratricopeptide (TPR) repeat protein